MIVHCPCCGAAVEVEPVLGYVQYDQSSQVLHASLAVDPVEHTCQGES